MTSKTTKFYSTAIAAALVATAVVPAASAADVTATKVSEGKYSITVEAAAKSTVTVYNSKGEAGTGTVTDTGTSVKVEFTYTAGETYTYKVKPAGGEESTAKTIEIPTSTALEAAKITVNDSATAKKDTIKITGLDKSAKNVVTVYTADPTDSAKRVVFATGTAKKGEAALTIALTDKELNDLRPATGTAKLYVTVQTGTKEVSPEVAVDVPLKAVAEAANVASIYSVNNTVAKDTVTISGVKAKDTVKFYAAASINEDGTLKANQTPVKIQKVSKNGAVTVAFNDQFTKEQVAAEKGLYVTVTGADSYESAPVGLKLQAEEQTTNVGVPDATNLLGKKDTVKVTGLSNGATVKIYVKDAVENDKLKEGQTAVATAKANKKGEAVVKITDGFTADHVTNDMHYTVTDLQKLESTPKALTVDPEPKTSFTATANRNVFVNNISGTAKDTVTVKEESLAAGTVVNVYATTDVTPATTGGDAKPATLKDGVKPVGTAKINAQGAATIKIKGGLEQYETDTKNGVTTGGLYISAVTKAHEASDLTLLAVNAADVSTGLTTGEGGNTTFTNVVGAKSDVVTVKGAELLEKGDIVNVYKAADVKEVEGIATVNAGAKPIATTKVAANDANAVAKVKAGFATKEKDETTPEKVYVTLQKVNENPSVPLELTITKEATSVVVAADVTYTNNIDLKDTITIKNLGAKDVVEVFEKSTDAKPIAKATATGTETDGLVITLKKDYKAGDKVYVKLTKFNEHKSAAQEFLVPENTAKTTVDDFVDTNFITVDDNGKADATVTVADAKAGVIYTVYDGTTVLGTAKAAKDGILIVKLTKGTKYEGIKAKKLEMTARDYAKDESDKLEIQKAAS